ncbi:MAG TPA: MFS transporter [Chloroflexota bacterium]|nr:MFS transporter [Chloroflexota bacterium]
MRSVKSIQWAYNLVLFLFWLATALPLALSILLYQARGITLFEIGLAMAVYSATIVLLEVPTGGLADAVGRKRVTLLAYGLMALTGVIHLFTFTFPLLVVGWALYGVSRALASGALEAWFVDALQAADPEIDLQPALAKAGTVSLLALGMGTLAGSAIPQLFAGLPADGTAVLTPLAMPVLVSLVLKLILMGVVTTAVHEKQPEGAENSWRGGFRQMPLILRDAVQLSRRNSTIGLLLATTAAGGLAMVALETFWQPRFATLLGGAAENSLYFGVLMAASFGVGMAGNMAATPLTRWLRQRYALVAALAQGLFGLSLLVLAGQTAVPLAALFFWLTYFNMGLINSPHATLINREIPAARRSAMLSVQSLAGYAGAMLGSILLGYLAEQQSISAAWMVAGLVVVVSSGLYILIDRRQQETRYEPENALSEVS